ncbi:MAG: AAA family ATPase [Bacteroidia bacterium]
MKKEFNITGTCLPHLHYMMDNRAKLAGVMKMIEHGAYFTINRPRQYGKTTTMAALNKQLLSDPAYRVIRTSFEGWGEDTFASEEAFVQAFLGEIKKGMAMHEFADRLAAYPHPVSRLRQLSALISELVTQTPAKLVLLIDEVDKSSNHVIFLDFLGMLRSKYLLRMEEADATFHSVVLAGVHDIKSLKLRVRSDDTAQYNSPWNIAADFKVEMSFAPHEIAPMLVEYSQAEGVEIDVDWFADKLYYYTSGYPFLVSKLCKTIAEDLLPHKTERRWTSDDLEEAVRMLLRENNTLFDSLIKNLENNADLYQLAYRIIIDGDSISFNPHEPTISLGRLYGVFKDNGTLKIHNRIYEQLLYAYMSVKTEVGMAALPSYGGHFQTPQGLDLEAVLLKFQAFMRAEHSDKDAGFLERNGRLVFLAFLNPIINGHGHAFKEVQISEERRLDVVLTYRQHRYIIELKRWYGESYHQRGLDQLADYLDRQGVGEGYLLIFEDKKEKTQRQAWIEHRGKRVFAVWV